MKLLIAVLFAALMITSCGKTDTPEPKTTAAAATQKEKTPAETLATAKEIIQNGNFQLAKIKLLALAAAHPDLAEAAEANALVADIDKKLNEIAAENKRKADEAAAEKSRKLAEALKSFDKKTDEVSGVTFYTPRNEPILATQLKAYIAVKNGTPILRTIYHYYADTWLFVSGYIVSVDGNNHEFNNVKFERDNGSGSIWEWSDTVATDSDEALLKEVASSKKTIIRFNGRQYHDDHTMTADEKARLLKVVTAYELLK